MIKLEGLSDKQISGISRQVSDTFFDYNLSFN